MKFGGVRDGVTCAQAQEKEVNCSEPSTYIPSDLNRTDLYETWHIK
jgi:hypothetical protein